MRSSVRSFGHADHCLRSCPSLMACARPSCPPSFTCRQTRRHNRRCSWDDSDILRNSPTTWKERPRNYDEWWRKFRCNITDETFPIDPDQVTVGSPVASDELSARVTERGCDTRGHLWHSVSLAVMAAVAPGAVQERRARPQSAQIELVDGIVVGVVVVVRRSPLHGNGHVGGLRAHLERRLSLEDRYTEPRATPVFESGS